MPDLALLSILTLASESAGSSRVALDLLAILSAAGLVAMLAHRLNIATIPLYLVAGALIGPHALGLAGEGEGGAQGIGSMATVLLMFTVGLHVDFASLRGGLGSIAIITVAATALVAAATWPLAMLFGLSAPSALAVALALSLTSTAVILRVLEQRREMHTIQGRLTMGVTIMHDLVALVILAVVPLVAAWARSGAAAPEGAPPAPPFDLAQAVTAAAKSIGGIAVMILVARWGLPKLMRTAARSPESLIVLSAAMALLAAVLTSALGFSPELGAFLAGFLLAGTPVRFQIAGQLAPLRDLFMGVFFTVIGLGLPLAELAAHWWALPLAALLLIAIKIVAFAGVSWMVGAAPATAAYAGLALAQASEFSFVVLAVAVAAGAISDPENGSASAVVVLTLVVAPWMFGWGAAAGRRVRGWRHAPWIARSALRELPADEQPRMHDEGDLAAESVVAGAAKGQLAIVAGFGPVGRAVVDNLEKRGVVCTVIELNPKTVEKQHRLGRAVVYGDASNHEVLERAGLSRAFAAVLTMPDEDAVIRASSVIRRARPEIFIAARLNVLSRGLQAMSMGADHVVVEEMATAEAMASQVLLKLEQRAAGEDAGPRLYDFQSR